MAIIAILKFRYSDQCLAEVRGRGMARFEYRFVKASTGRTNKGSGTAYSQAELIADLGRKGIEPFDIVEVPLPPATEAQLDYMRDLEIPVVAGLDIREASDLITNKLEGLQPGSDADRRMAETFEIETTRFTSKDRIYGAIVRNLRARDDKSELARWYAYRVYRSNRERARGGLLTDPFDPRFEDVGKSLLSDSAALKSLTTAASSTLHDFRWFGKFNGREGDSTRTIAYKATDAALVSVGLLNEGQLVRHSPKAAHHDFTLTEQEPLARKAGCLGVLLLGFLGISLSGGLFSLLVALSA
ncbi:MAG: hypothetical protein DI537_42685 [Stutzerimonas stutzeri]|nr:MAG: hypothetical protein DI537_42685 [Stutzerimonas stutzeri]